MASRLETKLQQALADGAYYEAAELCKAMATRAAAKKDYATAASLLSSGAAAQIAAGAAAGGVQRGIELAVQMVALFGKAKLPADDANVGASTAACHVGLCAASAASAHWARARRLSCG